jgi:Caspase domain
VELAGDALRRSHEQSRLTATAARTRPHLRPWPDAYPVDVIVETESSALRQLEPIQEVVSRIESAAKVSVIVLDACRDSPLQERIRRIAVEKSRELSPPKGLPPVSVVGSNTLIVYATVPGETASDGTERNSPFTASLLKHIGTPGLEIELMFKRVTKDVLKSTGGKQQPERLSRLQNELILLPSMLNVTQQSAGNSKNPSSPFPMQETASKDRYAGTYTRTRASDDTATITVTPVPGGLSGGRYAVDGSAFWRGHIGDITFIESMKNNFIEHYEFSTGSSAPRKITLIFEGDGRLRVEEEGNGGYGLNVSFVGEYERH